MASYHSYDFKDICIQAKSIIEKTGEFIQQELGKVSASEVETKALNSLVSYVDKTAEEQLVAGLSQLLPEAVFLTEEATVKSAEGHYRWIIDPLDGTTNFLHQLPFFSISVALQQAGQTVVGIVLEVNRKECFYAWKDGGAFLNGHSIRTREITDFSESLIATGFPYYDYSRQQEFLKVLEHFMNTTRGIRRFGSAALDLAYVACGRFDLFFEYSLNAWDVAAGAFLVKEAGGKVSDFAGGSQYLFGREILASAKGLHTQGLEVMTALASDKSGGF